MRRLTGMAAALALCAPIWGIAGAASAADLGGGGYKDGGPAPADDFAINGLTVGGIAVVMPKYEGSSHYELRGFPYLLPSFSGGPGFLNEIDARGLDDVRFELFNRGGFIAGPLAGYSLGRDESDGRLLQGLGDIDGGVVLGGFVGYRQGIFQFDVAYRHYFDDSEGYQIDFNAQVERPISQRVTFTGSVGATYADENYMDTYFGTGAFQADAGFKDIHIQAGLKAELDPHWTAKASLRYSRLLGDAADSPIVEDENQWLGTVGLSYKFDR